jgi:alpha-tubulin suppressor-like RCC1 family protein
LTAVAISAHEVHTCAISTQGAIYCWGQSTVGDLGPNGGEDSTATPVLPVVVTGLPAGSTPVAVAAGGAFTCALLSAGTIYCWGYNGYGQLGPQGGPGGGTPVQLTGLPAGTKAIAVAAGELHACALLDNGTAYCWGDNQYGQLGPNGGSGGGTPAQVTGLPAGTRVVGLAAGTNHTCATLDDGKAYCWGLNEFAQLGPNGGDGSNTPVVVAGLLAPGTKAIGIAAGELHTCAVLDNGAAYCWGGDTVGQVGPGFPSGGLDDPAPTLITGLPAGSKVVALASGGYHNCALLDSGQVYCWGFDADGQLGPAGTAGSETGSSTPLQVTGFVAKVD